MYYRNYIKFNVHGGPPKQHSISKKKFWEVYILFVKKL
jgi:hypothetical protein